MEDADADAEVLDEEEDESEVEETGDEDDSEAEVDEEASELAVLDYRKMRLYKPLEMMLILTEAGVVEEAAALEDESEGETLAEVELATSEEDEEGIEPAPATPMGTIGRSGKSAGERFFTRRLRLRWA